MEQLKNLRKQFGFSLQDMASRLHVSRTFYWQIENNKRRISYDLAILISKIFDKTPDEIFYEDIKKKPYKKRIDK